MNNISSGLGSSSASFLQPSLTERRASLQQDLHRGVYIELIKNQGELQIQYQEATSEEEKESIKEKIDKMQSVIQYHTRALKRMQNIRNTERIMTHFQETSDMTFAETCKDISVKFQIAPSEEEKKMRDRRNDSGNIPSYSYKKMHAKIRSCSPKSCLFRICFIV